MSASKHILIAMDDTEATERAVTYVATIIDGHRGFRVCFFHVFAPLPPKLVEFGGSEDPQEEEKREVDLKAVRAQWMARAAAGARPASAKAQARLRTVGVDAHVVGNPAGYLAERRSGGHQHSGSGAGEQMRHGRDRSRVVSLAQGAFPASYGG